ncbi:MAG: endonuclease/exonuclease/phosphatase family protein [Pseudomonadota bacterium]
MLGVLRWSLRVGAAAICAALIAGWFGAAHPAFDSFGHFRLVLSGALVVLLPLLWFARVRKTALLSVLVVGVSLVLTLPHLPGMKRGFAIPWLVADKPQFRLVQYNIRFNNRSPRAAADMILAAKPDLVILQEHTVANRALLDTLKVQLPHTISCAAFGVGSVAMASRFPLDERLKPECARFSGFSRATFKLSESQSFTAVSFHVLWPWPFRQQSQLLDNQGRFQRLLSPLLIAGDFNAAPWSAAVNRVAAWTGTTIISGAVHSWGPSESRKLPSAVPELPFPLLPIDQVLYSSHFAPITRRALDRAGSDHTAILTEFAFVGKQR